MKNKAWKNADPSNMLPGEIDLRKIDPALRPLVRRLNSTSWCRTIGSCSGKADHAEHDSFYVILEVTADRGLCLVREWASHAHQEGYNACYKSKTIREFALPHLELESGNFLYGERNSERWVKLHLKLFNAGPLSRSATKGGIRALEMGLDRLVEQHPEAGPCGDGTQRGARLRCQPSQRLSSCDSSERRVEAGDDAPTGFAPER